MCTLISCISAGRQDGPHGPQALRTDVSTSRLATSTNPQEREPPGRNIISETYETLREDHVNFYSRSTARDLALVVSLAAPVANTAMDENFQGWYQRRLRTSRGDDFARFWKTFGEGRLMILTFAGLSIAGRVWDELPLSAFANEYADRVTRSYLVGGPPLLFMQVALGGSRPNETSLGSQWRPFRDNNSVSGHAFIGAVPFITAAKMSENNWSKGFFYLLSALPAWSRVNDDAHYLSQAFLGWWLAHLSCRAVDQGESKAQTFSIFPLISTDAAGIFLVSEW